MGILVPRRAADPSSVAVLAPAGALPALAVGAGVALARRARAPYALVCLYRGVEPAPRLPSSGGLADSLAARGIDSTRRGRVMLVELPADPDAAASQAGRSLGAAGALPCVVGASVRAGAVDRVLATLDGVLVAPPPGAPLADLCWSSAGDLGLPTARVDPALGGPLTRALAAAGRFAPSGVRDAVAELVA